MVRAIGDAFLTTHYVRVFHEHVEMGILDIQLRGRHQWLNLNCFTLGPYTVTSCTVKRNMLYGLIVTILVQSANRNNCYRLGKSGVKPG